MRNLMLFVEQVWSLNKEAAYTSKIKARYMINFLLAINHIPLSKNDSYLDDIDELKNLLLYIKNLVSFLENTYFNNASNSRSTVTSVVGKIKTRMFISFLLRINKISLNKNSTYSDDLDDLRKL